MPAPLVAQADTVICVHGGQARPGGANPRVLVAGSPVVVVPTPWLVAGCALPPSAGGPCAGATWTSGTVRVRASGQPLVLRGGAATCAPTGTPLVVSLTQPRVGAS
ncbi:hypothetical protein [Actinomycetospora flava]|uniref:Uncharacterized protein n=1 Tax=Actinomycetospora flava TaxID=3129232 RepID=A0ABU8M6T8_9PSEU